MTLKPRDLGVWGTSTAALTAEPSYAQMLPGHLEANQPSPYWQNWWQRLMHYWADYHDRAHDDAGGFYPQEIALWGPGVDGDVAVTGELLLERDAFYRNMTFATGGYVLTNGFRLFVSDTLDMTFADARAIQATGLVSGTMYESAQGAAGGVTGVGMTPTALTGYLGGLSGAAGGAGGAGDSGSIADSGGAGGAAVIGGPGVFSADEPFLSPAFSYYGGSPGSGGGAGGPFATSLAEGGRGGSSGGMIFISARRLRRDTQTSEGAIDASGDDGEDGDDTLEDEQGAGGGGGGGGSGGAVLIRTHELLGTGKVRMINVSGGNGGDGGSAFEDGWSHGIGGNGGSAGAVYYWNTQTPSFTSLTGGAGAVPLATDDEETTLQVGGLGAILYGDL
jgi:hypothetical protein